MHKMENEIMAWESGIAIYGASTRIVWYCVMPVFHWVERTGK